MFSFLFSFVIFEWGMFGGLEKMVYVCKEIRPIYNKYMRMNNIKTLLAGALILLLPIIASQPVVGKDGSRERKEWVKNMDRIARPMIWNLSEETLRANMPRETRGTQHDMSLLEAFGRTLCGIGPWLELGPDDTPEGRLRAEYIERTMTALTHAVDPESPDYLVWSGRIGRQPLVDAAFLCEGLVRARTQILERLDDTTRQNLIEALRANAQITPYESNWLLFGSMVEALLLELTGECNMDKLMYGVNRFMADDGWYVGDGLYSDGADYHQDFYNSIVIHPMLTDVLEELQRCGVDVEEMLAKQLRRQQRFAIQLERLISPEGTYPCIGRSICYRFGVFHSLAHTCYYHRLPDILPPAQVRSALSAVMKRQLKTKGNFDREGWLTIGFSGHQIDMSETYINTGSTYMCMAAFLPLGLPADDPFWADAPLPWTNLKAWQGVDVGADHAL